MEEKKSRKKEAHKVKFVAKGKRVVRNYTKEQLLVLASGQKIFETSKYKLVKLVNVKKMVFEQIDQFCSKVLKITKYHRGNPVFIPTLNTYSLLVNEKLVYSSKEKLGLFDLGQVIPVILEEIEETKSSLLTYSEGTMKSEKESNKPLFIAANILNKGIKANSAKTITQVLIPELTQKVLRVRNEERISRVQKEMLERGLPTPSYNTPEWEEVEARYRSGYEPMDVVEESHQANEMVNVPNQDKAHQN